MSDLSLTRRNFIQAVTLGGFAAGGLPRSEVLAKVLSAPPPVGNTPGVRRVGDAMVTDGSDAAKRAVSLAQEAATAGTFGVGGLLVDEDGRIIAQAVNSVLIGGALYDPTCHVERQLIDWFMANGWRASIARDKLTIVSSLDPCAMCAGAVIRSGMKAISVAEDSEAGIHAARTSVTGLGVLKREVQHDFAFFGVQGGRARSGVISSPRLTSSIPETLVTDAEQTLLASVSSVRQAVGKGSSRGAIPWRAETSVLSKIDALATHLSELFHRVSRPINVHKEKHRSSLRRLVDRSSCALVDSEGNVITSVKRDWNNSVTGSSILNAVRLYTHLRKLAAEMISIELPSAKHCSFIMQNASPNEAEMLMELGAVGSFLEEPRVENELPAIAFLSERNIDTADACMGYLPPLYARLGVTVGHFR